MAELRLFLLGSPRLERAGKLVELERRKAMALLAYLAVTREQHGRDALVTLLWPDYDRTRGRAALRRTLAAVNAALEDDRLDANRETIGLRRAAGQDIWLDVAQLQAFAAACRTHGHVEADVCAACLPLLTQAVGLYRGDFLSEFSLRSTPDFDDWQTFQGETMRHELAGILERLVYGHSARGELALAIDYARRWLALDPFHEPAHCQLMSLYGQAGQRHAALRQYAECTRLLERELGVTPQEATTRLYQSIRENARISTVGALRPPAGHRAVVSAELPPVRGDERTSADLDRSFLLLDRIVRGQLVGRDREVAQLRASWAKAAAGEGFVLVVSGEAGVGKTRLVRELCALATNSGARVLLGRCEAEAGAPYAPIAQMVHKLLDPAQDAADHLPDYIQADLRRLAPQVITRSSQTTPAVQLAAPMEREQLFASFVSCCEILTRQAPLLLWVEDVHWADRDTLRLLHYLAYRMSGMRLLVVMTYRDSSLDVAAPALHKTVLDLNRQRLADSLTLSRLGHEETRALLAGMLMVGGISSEFADSVYHETEGNPFFVEEVCKALIEAGKLYYSGQVWRRSDVATMVIPQSVRAAILSRIQRLPARLQELLRLAAILGREFDVAILRALSACGEATLTRALEQVERAQLLEEIPSRGHIRYAFVHGLIAFTLRESLSGLRRQRLHRRAAIAIEAHYPDDVEALAYHWAAAGERDQAILYARQAAQRAASRYAYDTAILQLQTALQLTETGDRAEIRLAVLEELADVHRLRGERAEAILLYREALDLWYRQTGADLWLAVRLSRKIGETFLRLPLDVDIVRFEILAQTSLERARRLTEREPPHPETVRLLTTLANDAWSARPRQDWEASEQYARAAVNMAVELDAPIERSLALDALTTFYGVRGRFRDCVQLAMERLAVARDPRFTDQSEPTLANSSEGGYTRARNHRIIH